MKYLKFKIITDGACRGNPGHSAIAFIILDEENHVLKEYSEYAGIGTNNQAEYNAIISALKAVKKFGNEVQCFSDSKLVVNQMNGVWRVKHSNMRPLWRTAIALKDTFQHISFTHVPRTDKFIGIVDQLANQTLDRIENPKMVLQEEKFKQTQFSHERLNKIKHDMGKNMGRSKESFRIRLDDGKTLSVAIFPTKKDPTAEVISVQVQNYEDESWKNFGKIAIYRSPEGNYSKLPDREKQSE